MFNLGPTRRLLCAMLIASLYACPGLSQAPRSLTAFDGNKAYQHVKKMVDIGPRPPGSGAIKKTHRYIQAELKGYGLKVSNDAFNGRGPRGNVPMLNIIAELPGRKSDVVMIAGHYDTKTQAGFVGANDGGSSAGAVLEL